MSLSHFSSGSQFSSVQVSSFHFSSGQAHTHSACESHVSLSHFSSGSQFQFRSVQFISVQVRLTLCPHVSLNHFSSGSQFQFRSVHFISFEPEPFQLRLTLCPHVSLSHFSSGSHVHFKTFSFSFTFKVHFISSQNLRHTCQSSVA